MIIWSNKDSEKSLFCTVIYTDLASYESDLKRFSMVGGPHIPSHPISFPLQLFFSFGDPMPILTNEQKTMQNLDKRSVEIKQYIYNYFISSFSFMTFEQNFHSILVMVFWKTYSYISSVSVWVIEWNETKRITKLEILTANGNAAKSQ